jgi:hypothetical protein
MDHEIRIRQLEEEIRHEQAMRHLQGDRLDAHDLSVASLDAILQVVGTRLDQVSEKLAEVAELQAQNAAAIRDLTQAIIRDRSNGHTK